MSRKKDNGQELYNFAFSSSLNCSSTNSICKGRSVVHGKLKGGSKQLEVRRHRSDSSETGGKFLPQRGDDTNASAPRHRVHKQQGDENAVTDR